VSETWLFLSPLELQNNPVCLDREAVRHIRALRLREGDPLFLSDGRGRTWRARLEGTAAQGVRAFLLEELVRHNEPPLHVTLLAAITKGEKMDQMVRGAVELGVKEIIPVLTSRTVVQLPPAKREEKTARWQKIAMAAASVCRRSYLPRIHHPLDFSELPALLAAKELVIVPWEGERERGLLALLKSIAVPPREVFIFTGPEGGFSGAEMAKLNELTPVSPVSLGPRILSAQTAPLTVLSVIMALWGDLG